MAFPNITDIVATTIEKRSKTLADNVTKNNALLAWLKASGNVKTVSGGTKIFQEFLFAENGNFSWYSGYEPLNVGASDVISGAEFAWKQAAAPVLISGLEELQNSGPEQMIDLMEGRVSAAEATMLNQISSALYTDGSGSGGKAIQGLLGPIPADPTTGTYGGIDRATWTFWRSQLQAPGAMTKDTIQANMNTLWAKCVRGQDRPKLVLLDANLWGLYMASLQPLQRFTGAGEANLGFSTVKFMDADVVLDGGIGGFCPANTGFFINPKYLFFRPHKDRNMVPLNPNRRVPFNQDASAQIIGWAGNMTSAGAQFQGFLKGY